MLTSRQDALELLHSKIQSINLRKHCYAVESAMGELAKYFKEDEAFWKIIGLIHDADYEQFPDKHPTVLIEELEKSNEDKIIIDAIKAHAWGYHDGFPEPKTKLEWSLYCCDELTGLIVAVTLIRPDKKLATVTVENVLSKWNAKSFAGGVNRKQIELCDEKLGINLKDFIGITLKSMQGISSELGL